MSGKTVTKKKRARKAAEPRYRPFSVCIPHCKIFDDTVQGEPPVILNLIITVWAKDARYAGWMVSNFLSEQISRESKP